MMIILCLAGLALYLASRRPPRVAPADPAVKDLAGAVEAYKVIQQNSYEGLSPQEACRGAIEGMAGQTDEFSAYLPPEKADTVLRRFDGTLEETGLQIADQDDRLVVVGPLAGSPAHKAKLFAGLEILSINGVEADYLTLAEARAALEAGGSKSLRLGLGDRDGRKSTVNLCPARFDVETVTGIARDGQGRWVHELDPEAGIYYLRIAEFVPRTPSEFHETYRELDEPRGVVLDLRDNPGGVLQAAAEIVDRFLSKGLIVRTVSRRGQQDVREAHPAGTYPPVPLVVLVNQRTVSAAEIVAGALQVHRRAVLVGRPTYGKWCVQSPVDLGYGLGRLYLSTARYFLPEPPEPPATAQTTGPATANAPVAADDSPRPEAGTRAGVQPDVPVRLKAGEARRLEVLRLRAMVMPAPKPRPPATEPGRMGRAERLRRDILKSDSQLAEALRLLKEEPVPQTQPAEGPPPAKVAQGAKQGPAEP